MNTYRVSFIKKLTNSYGKPFDVCQRSIDIRRARDSDRAIAAAKWRFERREGIAKWFLHADYVEIDTLSREAVAIERSGTDQRNRPGKPRRSSAPRSGGSGRLRTKERRTADN